MTNLNRRPARGQPGTNRDICPGLSRARWDRQGHTPLGVSPPVPKFPSAVRREKYRAGQVEGARLPSPTDVTEHAVLMEERGDCDRSTAEARALAAHGFSSWPALALAHAEQIRLELDRLPPACDATGIRLLAGTLRFITGQHWLICVSEGWPLTDVLGVSECAPRERADVLGLIPMVALYPRPGRRLIRITSELATFREPNGGMSTFRRPSLKCDVHDMVPWWQAPAIVGGDAA